MVGITNLCLSIAAFTGTIEEDEIIQAFETTRVDQINKWTLSNIGKTTLAKRMEVLKKGVKRKSKNNRFFTPHLRGLIGVLKPCMKFTLTASPCDKNNRRVIQK